jgi:hypothetical protein
VSIGEIRNTVQTLSTRENESAINVSRLTGEVKAIRDGLTIQQTLPAEPGRPYRPRRPAITAPPADSMPRQSSTRPLRCPERRSSSFRIRLTHLPRR